MAYMYVDVDLSDIDTDDLVEELEARDYTCLKDAPLRTGLDHLYELKRMDDPRFDEEFKEYVYQELGKIL